jgi:hypothetical protein
MEQTKTSVDHAMYYLSKLNWKVGAWAAFVVGVIVIFMLIRGAVHHVASHGHAPNLPPAVYQPSDAGETLPLKH